MSRKSDDDIRNMTKERIRRVLPQFTPVEENAASFFLENTEKQDFSSRAIASQLYLSEATLSRFAKKCGFRGYREFIYSYEKDLETELAASGREFEQDISVISRRVEANYQMLLFQSMGLLQEDTLRRVADLLNKARRVKIVGQGSSGFAALEFQLRFMRIGLEVEAITDYQVISMSASIADEGTLFIGITLSGRTRIITDSLMMAKNRGAKTVLFTASDRPSLKNCCDELVILSSLKNLDTGTRISPQFPVLIIFDVLYSYFYANDPRFKGQKLQATLSAIQEERDPGE